MAFHGGIIDFVKQTTEDVIEAGQKRAEREARKVVRRITGETPKEEESKPIQQSAQKIFSNPLMIFAIIALMLLISKK